MLATLAALAILAILAMISPAPWRLPGRCQYWQRWHLWHLWHLPGRWQRFRPYPWELHARLVAHAPIR